VSLINPFVGNKVDVELEGAGLACRNQKQRQKQRPRGNHAEEQRERGMRVFVRQMECTRIGKWTARDYSM
jgi:hypothetical protein